MPYCGYVAMFIAMPLAAMGADRDVQKQVDGLLAQMTLDEKIGQMVQADSAALTDKSDVAKRIFSAPF